MWYSRRMVNLSKRTEDRSHLLFGTIYLFLCSLFVIVFLIIQYESRPTVKMSLLVLVLLAFCALPFLVGSRKNHLDPLEPIYGFAIVYFTQFGFAPLFFEFFPSDRTFIISQDASPAIAVAAFGWIFFLLGYYGGMAQQFIRALPVLPSQWKREKLIPLLLLLLGSGWAARIYLVVGGAYFHIKLEQHIEPGFLLGFISDFPWLGLIVVGIAYHSGVTRRTRLASAVYIILVLLELIFAVPTGSKLKILRVLFGVLVPMMVCREQLNVKTLIKWGTILLVAYILVIQPIIALYRESPPSRLSFVVPAFVSSTKRIQLMSPKEYLLFSVRTFLSRAANIQGLDAVLYGVPRLMDFQMGRTLLWYFLVPIPRALWPDKPDYGRFGGVFGRAFGILSPLDTSTSIGVTLIGELYLNFHLLGVALGMAFYGVIWRLAFGYFMEQRPKVNLSGALLYIPTLWTILFRFEDIFVMAFGSLTEVLVFLYLIARFLSNGASQDSQRIVRSRP